MGKRLKKTIYTHICMCVAIPYIYMYIYIYIYRERERESIPESLLYN